MFDSVCARLFGENKQYQEKLLIKLMILSLVVLFIALVFNVQGGIALIFLIWGWRALCACIGITQIGKFFQYNIVVIVVSVAAWLVVGACAGVIVCIIGVIRFVQLRVERFKNKHKYNVK